MFGFLIGTACLVGLIKVARHGHGACGGYGYGYGHGPFGHHDDYGGPRRRGGFGRGVFLRHAFERLETTPGQEKVIVKAVDELKGALQKAKDDLRGTRKDFADVVRSESLDEASMTDIFMKHDTTVSEARRAVVSELQKIHEALTEKQRSDLADFLERGPKMRDGFARGPWGGGPYRRWA